MVYHHVPTCGFGPNCRCGAVKAFIDCHHEEYVMRFLISLNDSFSTI